MSTQFVPSASQRCHWRLTVRLPPRQVPTLAVATPPVEGVKDGSTSLTGLRSVLSVATLSSGRYSPVAPVGVAVICIVALSVPEPARAWISYVAAAPFGRSTVVSGTPVPEAAAQAPPPVVEQVHSTS